MSTDLLLPYAEVLYRYSGFDGYLSYNRQTSTWSQYVQALDFHCRFTTSFPLSGPDEEIPITEECIHKAISGLLYCVLNDARDSHFTGRKETMHVLHVLTELHQPYSSRPSFGRFLNMVVMVMHGIVSTPRMRANEEIVHLFRMEEHNVDLSVLEDCELRAILTYLGTKKRVYVSSLLSILYDALVRSLHDVFVSEMNILNWCEIRSHDDLREKLSIPLVRLLVAAASSRKSHRNSFD